MIDNARRVACLTELGITIYRRKDDGGLVAEEDLNVEREALVDRSGSNETSASSAEEIVQSLANANEPIQSKEQELQADAAAKAQPKNIAFELCWQRAEDLLFVEAIELDANDTERKKLLVNIISALRNQVAVEAEESLNWPFSGAPSTTAAASEMLSGFLAEQIEQNASTKLVLFGETITDLLLAGEMSFQEVVGARVRLMGGELETHVCPASGEMLANPIAKIQSWNLLKTLS